MSDSATTAWKNAVVAAGGTVSAGREALVDNLVVGLKADGIFSKLDRLWLFKAENSQSALIDLVAASAATAVNSPTFTADAGYAGNGTSAYLDTNFNPSSGTPLYALNSATVFAWNNTAASAGVDQGSLCGDVGGSVRARIYPHYSNNTCYFSLHNSQDGIALTAPGTGLLVNTRTTSTDETLDQNGVQVKLNADPTTSIPTTNLSVLSDGAAYGVSQASCYGCGGGLSSGERIAIYSRLAIYMASVFSGYTVTDAETAKWICAVVGNGGSVSSARAALVQSLIVGLKADGIWSKLDRLWLFRAENSQSALIDLVAAAVATAVNSPTFTADQGYTTSGAQYVDSNFNPTSGSPHYVRDNACSFGWIYSISASVAGALLDAAGTERIFPWYVDTNVYYAVNAPQLGVSSPQGPGLYAGNRSGSNLGNLYKNGSLFNTDNVTPSSAVANSTYYVGNSHGLGESLNNPISCVGFGGSLTSTEHGNLYTRLNTYMVGVSAPPTDTITVTQASVLFTGKTVTIRDTEIIPVTKASVTFTGKTVTIRDLDTIPVLKATATFAGQTVTIRDLDVIPVLKASVVFTGQTVTITNLVATQVIPVGKGDILFSGQNIVISTTGKQPPILLPGGGGVFVPPWRDLDRKKRRRYRALEEIEQRLDARIERLEAESQEKQQEVAAVLSTVRTDAVSQRYDDLLRRQAQVSQMLHEAQRRAQAVRQEKIELARLARIAAEAADEEEAIIALLSF